MIIINMNNNDINTKTTKTNRNIIIFYILSSFLISGLSIFSVQASLAQLNVNENKLSTLITNNNNNTNDASETTSFTTDNKKPNHVPNQIIVIAEDIEEIRDNLQKTREALKDANYLQVLSHINNIDQLLTAVIVSEPSTSTNNTTSNVDSTALVSSNTGSLLKENNKLITIKDGNDEELKINKQLFAPNNLNISKGTSVMWLNKDNLPHTITLKKLGEQPREFKFALSLGDSYKYTFDEVGVYGFYSDKSHWSEGKIIVS